jgi:hypothetical protein
MLALAHRLGNQMMQAAGASRLSFILTFDDAGTETALYFDDSETLTALTT